jgi:hypothetical protein
MRFRVGRGLAVKRLRESANRPAIPTDIFARTISRSATGQNVN